MKGNAQNQKTETILNKQNIPEETRKTQNQLTKKVASPYDGNVHKSLNPLSPNCRNVSKNKIIDYGNIRVLYAFNAKNIAEPQTYDDLQRLEIGTKSSKYYSYYVFQRDSSITSEMIEFNKKNNMNFDLAEGENRGKNTASVTMVLDGKFQGWSEYIFAELFKDFSTNELTEYCRMPQACAKYNSQYTEPMPAQNWQMQDETRNVAGYLCQKATCNFRGRNYTAWFAADIPINQGPWKFGGLPGLIMKVYDSKEEYVFECVGIENHSEKFPIILLDTYKSYGKTTRQKLNKLLKSIQENYYQLSGILPRKGETFPPLNPHNPLELE